MQAGRVDWAGGVGGGGGGGAAGVRAWATAPSSRPVFQDASPARGLRPKWESLRSRCSLARVSASFYIVIVMLLAPASYQMLLAPKPSY
jgi:hypothetical protein